LGFRLLFSIMALRAIARLSSEKGYARVRQSPKRQPSKLASL
jgi:hypothetical protein